MINQSKFLYINSKKYTVLKQVDDKFLLENDLKLKVHNINQNRSTGVLYEDKIGQNVVVSISKKIKYIGDDKKWKVMLKAN